jgi:hypothetical protein
MPRGKHFDVVEKSKIMAWHFEKVPAKEITACLNRNVSTVFKIICENKVLPITKDRRPLELEHLSRVQDHL